MAQIILTICDLCLDETGGRVEGQVISFGGREMDMCEEHQKRTPIADLHSLIEHHGRPVQTLAPAPKPGRKKAAQSVAGATQESLSCPHGCNHGKPYRSLQGKRQHMTRAHKAEAA